MFRKLFFLSLFFLTSLHASPWVESYEEALALSKEKKAPIALFFTGSDWSAHGMKMRKEVLDSEAFQKSIGERLLLVEIDFPQHTTLSERQKEQNLALRERFGIEELPRLILLDPQQREISRLGYLPEEGSIFARELLSLYEKDQRLKLGVERVAHLTSIQLQNLYKIAEELGRQPEAQVILKQGLVSDEPFFFIIERYRILSEKGHARSREARLLREKISYFDPDNAHGLHFSLAVIDFQTRAQEEASPREVIRPLEEYLVRFGRTDTEHVWQIEMMLAQFYLDNEEGMTALRHAKRALELAPVERKEEIANSLDYIERQATVTASAD